MSAVAVDTAGTAASASPKVDPETLVLRASPRPVVRFRRGLLIGVTALGSASIIAVTWLALQPAGLRLAAASEELYSTDRKAPPEAVSQLPGSYGEMPNGVPKLGPPLPGDLGRPILEHQRAAQVEPTAVSSTVDIDRAAQARAAERDRRIADRRAAREAGVLAKLSGASAAGQAPDRETGPATLGADVRGEIIRQGASGRPTILSGSRDAATSRHRVQPAASRWQLDAGTVIPAALVTGFNSDLPGLVVAQVTENVFDSATGRTLLIPQGSRLIGGYDSVVAFGQSRALLVWQRLILPDGSSLQLDNTPASDAAGYAGLQDKVDFHSWRLLKGIALSTLLGVGSEISLGSTESDLVRAIREATQQNVERAGQQIVSKNLSVQPTITVRPGWPLRTVVHKDLVLQPWRG